MVCASQWETLFFARSKGGHRDPKASREPGHMPHSPRGLPPRLPAGAARSQVRPPREGQVRLGGEGAVDATTEVTPAPPHGPAAAVPLACCAGKEAFRQDPGNWSQKSLDSLCCTFLDDIVFYLEEEGSVWKTQESGSESPLVLCAVFWCVFSQFLILENHFETACTVRRQPWRAFLLSPGTGCCRSAWRPSLPWGSGHGAAGPILSSAGCTFLSPASFASRCVGFMDTTQFSGFLETVF